MTSRLTLLAVAAIATLILAAATPAEGAITLLQGTYNVSVWRFEVPTATARGMLPGFVTLGRSDEDLFPTAKDGKVTTVIEAGRQIDNGVVGTPGFLNNQESKVQIPDVSRVPGRKGGFIHKNQIYTDTPLTAASGTLAFGLGETVTGFKPPNSASSSTFDYETVGFFSISNVATASGPGKVPDSEFARWSGQPWFGDGLQCGQHRYTLPGQLVHLRGDLVVESAALNGAPRVVQKGIEGVQFVAPFTISGPAVCALLHS